ncbi:MAG: hypothetical protein EON48_06400, partial [Acetobacteraceae bacterium]
MTSQLKGSDYLKAIRLEKVDPYFYSALLLRFVDDSEGLTRQLVATLSAREKNSGDTSNLSVAIARKHLTALDDLQT